MDTWQLAVAALVALVCYLVVCRIWPFVPCRWCEGSKRYRQPRGKAWRDCPHCHGSGRKVRLGARITGGGK